MTRSHTFSRASRQLHALASSFDWLNRLPVSFVIGQSNYFSFGFTTFNWNLPLTETHGGYYGNYIHSSFPMKGTLLHKHKQKLNYNNIVLMSQTTHFTDKQAKILSDWTGLLSI